MTDSRMGDISYKTTPCSLLHTDKENYKFVQPIQDIQKTKAIYCQSLMRIEMEQYGTEEWPEHNQNCCTTHLICPENNEMSSNSLNA